MTDVSYQPIGSDGFTLRVLTNSGLLATMTLQPDDIEPTYEGDAELVANPALMESLAAYGGSERSFRRSRSDELRDNHQAAAKQYLRRAVGIADLVECLGDESRAGWCSACFKQTKHSQVVGGFRAIPAYLCATCGSPTTPCAVPGCESMANRRSGSASAPRYCAEHRHDVPSFSRMAERLTAIEDYADWLAFDKRNARRTTQIVSTVVIAGAVIVPGAIAAAPAIGGALGAFGTGLSGAAATSHGLALLGGGALAAGGYGMAGGVAVVAATGAAVGGTLGGLVSAAYASADKSFHIEKLRDGTGPAVILANGFLSEGNSGWGPWRTMIDERYPDNTIYRVTWGAKNLAKLSTFVGAGGARQAVPRVIAKTATRAARSAPKVISNAFSLPLLAAEAGKNPWHVAARRAEMTGVVLADLIARTEQDSFILVGHSLGARVMASAARVLGSRDAAPKITEMHLLGAAVSTGKDWQSLTNAVDGVIWNYYTSNDDVLKILYKVAQAGQNAVGSRGFNTSLKKIVDRDVSRRVDGHSKYFSRVALAR